MEASGVSGAEAWVKADFPRAFVDDVYPFGVRRWRVYASDTRNALILGESETPEGAWEAAWTWLQKHRVATGARRSEADRARAVENLPDWEGER